MATIKAVLKATERKTDGRHLVMLRLTRDRKTGYLGLNIYLQKSDWNPQGKLDKANWVSKKNDLHREYNCSIKEEWLRLDRLQLEHPGLSAAQIKSLSKRGCADLMAFFREALEQIQQEVAANTATSYTTGFKHLEEYTGGILPALDLSFLRRYEAYLLQRRKRNTASLYLGHLKMLTRKAVEAGVLAYADNPFNSFKLKSGKVHKARLTAAEVAALVALRMQGEAELARRAFLVQFFLSGMRISDLLQLRWEQVQEDRVEYRSQKTGALLSMKIPAPALELMGERGKGYVFPYLEKGLEGKALSKRLAAAKTSINGHLKKIAAKANIDKILTTHVARHSFASLAWANSRDIKAVSQALGHTSVGMTETYLRDLTHQEQDGLLDAAFRDFV